MLPIARGESIGPGPSSNDMASTRWPRGMVLVVNVDDPGHPAVGLPDLFRCRAFVCAHLVGEPPASEAEVLCWDTVRASWVQSFV